jgi:hypothetical protein
MNAPTALPEKVGVLGIAPARSRRSYGVVALGVLMLLGGVLGGITLYESLAGEAVLAAGRPVALGHVFKADDLTVVHLKVTDGTVDRVSADEQSSVIGHTAAVPLLPGELLGRGAVGVAVTVPPGDAVVGISLKRGQFPIGLTAGEPVWVVGNGAAPAAQGVAETAPPIPATILATEALSDDPQGTTVFSLLLQDTNAAAVTQMSAAGHASLALIPPSPQ